MFKHSKSKHINLAKLYNEAEGIYSKIPAVKKRKKRLKTAKIIKWLSLSILFVFFLLIVFFIYLALELRTVYYSSMSGKDNAEYAVHLIKEKDYAAAKKFAVLAEDDFEEALNIINGYWSNPLISGSDYLSSQYNELMYLVSTANILSSAVANTADFAASFSDVFDREISFKNLSIEEKRNVLRKIYQSAPELSGIKANLDLALLNLDKLQFRGILWPVKEKITNFKEELKTTNVAVTRSIPMSQIIPAIFGYPAKSTYLVMLQNSDELRPTGGFLGTYGILQTENGDIIRYDTHDIYHMDMPVKDLLNVEPPEPLVKYLGVDKWYMRDSNWSPNWPTAANKIQWFYHKENELLPPIDQINDFDGDFNGVIAITPEFITDLLEITGPVILEGEEYNYENFVDLLQYKVEKGYVDLGTPSWHRKETIGDIVEILKERLFEQSLMELLNTFSSISNNLAEKNVLINMYDEQLQGLIEEQGWAGKLEDTEGDYFMVVDANMAALKTDAVMNRAIDYSTTQSQNGLISNLKIRYSHNGDFNWKTTRYRTYTRIYVPLNSQLIEFKGLSQGEAEIYNELGKTVFAGFLSVEPGEISTLDIRYKLPLEIVADLEKGSYKLYAQKQPGNDIKTLTVRFNFAKNVESYQPTGFYVNSTGQGLSWNTDLMVDRVFFVDF